MHQKFSGIKSINFVQKMVGKINNRKIKVLSVKEKNFGTYFVLKNGLENKY
jgi:hypothetical protein